MEVFNDIPSALFIFAAIAAGSAAGSLLVTLRSLRRRTWLGSLVSTMTLLPTLLLLLVAGLLLLNAWGYRSLTQEQIAAWVETRPLGPQQFLATVRYPDGRKATYRLSGDELYVDARILKWKYWANLLGLQTRYELDRIAGRYRHLTDERDKPRTVFNLRNPQALDAFELRQKFTQLSPLLDAEYGSATFIPADGPADYEIRVSTTGLLARPLREGNGS